MTGDHTGGGACRDAGLVGRVERTHGLEAAVRMLMSAGFPATLQPGDILGPIARGNSVVSWQVRSVAATAFHTPAEAARAAARLDAEGGSVAIVLYDRTFNVVVTSQPLGVSDARSLNAQLAGSGRFEAAHAAQDRRAPVVVSVVSGGTAMTVARTPRAHATRAGHAPVRTGRGEPAPVVALLATRHVEEHSGRRW